MQTCLLNILIEQSLGGSSTTAIGDTTFTTSSHFVKKEMFSIPLISLSSELDNSTVYEGWLLHP